MQGRRGDVWFPHSQNPMDSLLHWDLSGIQREVGGHGRLMGVVQARESPDLPATRRSVEPFRVATLALS